jgi:hypothetical protein
MDVKGMLVMGICPLCNGFYEIHPPCQCGSEMKDSGKEMDYYDDYSAYMEIDDLKLENGYLDDHKAHKCPHLFTCPQCSRDRIIFIDE